MDESANEIRTMYVKKAATGAEAIKEETGLKIDGKQNWIHTISNESVTTMLW